MNKAIAELWQDYLFLTQEMEKFIKVSNTEMFLNLMEQRKKVQELIIERNDQQFSKTPAGQELLTCIAQKDQLIKSQLEFVRNAVSRQRAVADAYDGGHKAGNGQEENGSGEKGL